MKKEFKLGFIEALIITILTISVLSYCMIFLGWVPHLAIIMVLSVLFVYGRLRGLKFDVMQKGMAEGVMSGIGAIYLFFFIGLLVSALMYSGAIPTLMNYGFSYLNPKYFYLSTFVATSLLGIAIGSSLTTCATLGVAFISMASAYDASPIITAGAIVSGAFFGDKMSPLSDTTGIAASIVGIDLFEHIKNMLHTTVPAWILSALIFIFLPNKESAETLNIVQEYQQQLQNSGLINPQSLYAFLVLIVMAFLRCGAIFTIIATIIASLILKHGSIDIKALGSYFFTGYKADESLGAVAKMISRGGINSMFFTQTIVILALSLGGLLQALGVLSALFEKIVASLRNIGQLTLASASTALGINILIGEQYLSLLLTGNTYKPIYDKLGIPAKNLARTVEDAGTVINPLVPWSVCGVFISEILHVPVLSYLPFAFFCYFSLILTIIYGFSGWTLSREKQQN